MAKRGRPNKTDAFLRKSIPKIITNVASMGQEIFDIPNHSGDHSAGRVNTQATTDQEIVNKKFVDDKLSSEYVPYTAATKDVNLGIRDLTATRLNISTTATWINSLANIDLQFNATTIFGWNFTGGAGDKGVGITTTTFSPKIPSTGEIDFGASNARWKDGFLTTLDVSGIAATGDLTVTDSVIFSKDGGGKSTIKQADGFGNSTLWDLDSGGTAGQGFLQILTGTDDSFIISGSNFQIQTDADNSTSSTVSLILGDTSINSSSEDIGVILFRGVDSAIRTGAEIKAVPTATWGASTNDAPTDLEFYTQSDGNTSTLSNPGIRIKSSGELQTLRGRIINRTAVTNTYTALITDHFITANRVTAFTITLPASVDGQEFHIKNINIGAVTVDGNGSETIDGALTAVLNNQFDSITIVGDGTNWHII